MNVNATDAITARASLGKGKSQPEFSRNFVVERGLFPMRTESFD
jgi:hypothetical protein